MKILAALLAIVAIVFAVVSGMSLVPNAGIKATKDHAECNGGFPGGGPPPPPPPTNSSG